VAPLATLVSLGRTIRVIGFDDAPFDKHRDATVNVAGVVCAGTRFEGMVWGSATRDGDDATDVIAALLLGSKFHAQVHLLLLDGLGIGGLNLVDLPSLAERVALPCVAVMRRMPDFAAIEAVADRFPDADRRRGLLRAGGPVHTAPGVFFQVAGAEPDEVRAVLPKLTDRGHVPEALRIAHLIGSAIRTGQSGRRA
jgi:hypothetical protein